MRLTMDGTVSGVSTPFNIRVSARINWQMQVQVQEKVQVQVRVQGAALNQLLY